MTPIGSLVSINHSLKDIGPTTYIPRSYGSLEFPNWAINSTLLSYHEVARPNTYPHLGTKSFLSSNFIDVWHEHAKRTCFFYVYFLFFPLQISRILYMKYMNCETHHCCYYLMFFFH